MKEPKQGVITDAHNWREYFKNTHLSYYDLSGDTIVTIKEMSYDEITGPGGRKDNCLVMHFAHDMLPMIVNTTNAKMVSDLTKTNKPIEWIGKSITLYPNENVKMKGETVGGIRIRATLPAVSLPKINKERFDKMAEAIKKGRYSLDKALYQFDYTTDQLSQLKALKDG